MYIAEIEISNLRSFRGKQTISLDRGDGTYAGWTVFAGRNGAGKSTLLKAIAAAVAGPLAVRSLTGSVPDWVRTGVTTAKIAVKLAPDRELDLFDDFEGDSSPFWTGLQWQKQKQGTSFTQWLGKEKKARRDFAERGPWSDEPMGWFISGYGPYRRLGPATSDVIKVSNDPKLARLINLFSEAATLSDAVDWLKEQHLRALEKKKGAKELRDNVLRLLDDELLPDGSKIQKVDSEGLWITRDKVTVPLREVSDGYRTVTALVVDLVRRLHATYRAFPLDAGKEGLSCPLPGVVLIDEIDAHMHVEWQQKIGLWLTRHFPNIQFLTTSHSPFICQAASPRGIIRLPAPGELRSIEHLEPRLFNAVVNGGADDAVMSELFGLEHAHSRRAEALRQRVAALELKLLTSKARPAEQREYDVLRQQLPDDLGELADRKLRMVRGGGARKR
jgi:energy-coupling factor transporter ATP-binding protein EcfA2